eukprot:7742704-Pyramimonas_sp.AAC.1
MEHRRCSKCGSRLGPTRVRLLLQQLHEWRGGSQNVAPALTSSTFISKLAIASRAAGPAVVVSQGKRLLQ